MSKLIEIWGIIDEQQSLEGGSDCLIILFLFTYIMMMKTPAGIYRPRIKVHRVKPAHNYRHCSSSM